MNKKRKIQQYSIEDHPEIDGVGVFATSFIRRGQIIDYYNHNPTSYLNQYCDSICLHPGSLEHVFSIVTNNKQLNSNTYRYEIKKQPIRASLIFPSWKDMRSQISFTFDKFANDPEIHHIMNLQVLKRQGFISNFEFTSDYDDYLNLTNLGELFRGEASIIYPLHTYSDENSSIELCQSHIASKINAKICGKNSLSGNANVEFKFDKKNHRIVLYSTQNITSGEELLVPSYGPSFIEDKLEQKKRDIDSLRTLFEDNIYGVKHIRCFLHTLYVFEACPKLKKNTTYESLRELLDIVLPYLNIKNSMCKIEDEKILKLARFLFMQTSFSAPLYTLVLCVKEKRVMLQDSLPLHSLICVCKSDQLWYALTGKPIYHNKSHKILTPIMYLDADLDTDQIGIFGKQEKIYLRDDRTSECVNSGKIPIMKENDFFYTQTKFEYDENDEPIPKILDLNMGNVLKHICLQIRGTITKATTCDNWVDYIFKMYRKLHKQDDKMLAWMKIMWDVKVEKLKKSVQFVEEKKIKEYEKYEKYAEMFYGKSLFGENKYVKAWEPFWNKNGTFNEELWKKDRELCDSNSGNFFCYCCKTKISSYKPGRNLCRNCCNNVKEDIKKKKEGKQFKKILRNCKEDEKNELFNIIARSGKDYRVMDNVEKLRCLNKQMSTFEKRIIERIYKR